MILYYHCINIFASYYILNVVDIISMNHVPFSKGIEMVCELTLLGVPDKPYPYWMN